MKKKKQEKWYEKDYIPVYPIFGILLAIIIMGFYALYPFEPEFIIKKEVCEEKTFYLDRIMSSQCRIGCAYYAILSKDTSYSTECKQRCIDDYYYVVKTCKQVEVDELPVGYLSHDLEIPSCKFIVNIIIGNIMDYGLLDKGGGVCATISKQDLTTEWLNENSECSLWYSEEHIANDNSCIQWEYKNYTIEIK